MTDGVGRVLAKLRELKIEENTLIFFISDNGGPTPQTSSRNDPPRAYKGQVWEGGIRIPFLIQWKGRLPGGKVYNLPAISLEGQLERTDDQSEVDPQFYQNTG